MRALGGIYLMYLLGFCPRVAAWQFTDTRWAGLSDAHKHPVRPWRTIPVLFPARIAVGKAVSMSMAMAKAPPGVQVPCYVSPLRLRRWGNPWPQSVIHPAQLGQVPIWPTDLERLFPPA